MAVLSDHELWSLIRSDRLRIDPPPAFSAVSPSAIDLTLDADFVRLATLPAALKTRIDTRDSSQVMEALAHLGSTIVVEAGQPFVLERINSCSPGRARRSHYRTSCARVSRGEARLPGSGSRSTRRRRRFMQRFRAGSGSNSVTADRTPWNCIQELGYVSSSWRR